MDISSEHGSSSPQHVDHVLRTLGREHSAHERKLGRWLLQGFRVGVHRLHGYGSFREYAARVFGFTGRSTEERLRTAKALEHLPLLAEAFSAGSVPYSVVRELTRIVTPETEASWLEATRGRTAREVERMLSGLSQGDRPTDPRRPEAERKRVSFDLSPESYAMLGEARRALTQRCGHGLDDDSLVGLLAEAVLSGGQGRDAGRSAYQVALTVCESCRHASQEAGSEPVAVPLCSAHHRAVHDGRLVVSGSHSEGFVFTHADGSPYGAPQPNSDRARVLAEVFQILASMGFRQREARQMLDDARPHVGAHVGVEEALRAVLQRARVTCMAERVEPYGVGEAGAGLALVHCTRPSAVDAVHEAGRVHVRAEAGPLSEEGGPSPPSSMVD